MANNIIKKNIERNLIQNSSIPTDNANDVQIKRNQIIAAAINLAYTQLLQNDLYNERALLLKSNYTEGLKLSTETNIKNGSDYSQYIGGNNGTTNDLSIVQKIPYDLSSTPNKVYNVSSNKIVKFGNAKFLGTSSSLLSSDDLETWTNVTQDLLNSSTTSITDMYLDNEQLFIATNSGIYRFEYNIEDSLELYAYKITTENATAVLSSDKYVYYGTATNLLFKIKYNEDTQTFDLIKSIDGIDGKINQIEHLSSNTDDQIIVGSNSGLYTLFNQYGFDTPILATDSFEKNETIIDCVQFTKTTLYIATSKGVYYVTDNNGNITKKLLVSDKKIKQLVSINGTVYACGTKLWKLTISSATAQYTNYIKSSENVISFIISNSIENNIGYTVAIIGTNKNLYLSAVKTDGSLTDLQQIGSNLIVNKLIVQNGKIYGIINGKFAYISLNVSVLNKTSTQAVTVYSDYHLTTVFNDGTNIIYGTTTGIKSIYFKEFEYSEIPSTAIRSILDGRINKIKSVTVKTVTYTDDIPSYNYQDLYAICSTSGVAFISISGEKITVEKKLSNILTSYNVLDCVSSGDYLIFLTENSQSVRQLRAVDTTAVDYTNLIETYLKSDQNYIWCSASSVKKIEITDQIYVLLNNKNIVTSTIFDNIQSTLVKADLLASNDLTSEKVLFLKEIETNIGEVSFIVMSISNDGLYVVKYDSDQKTYTITKPTLDEEEKYNGPLYEAVLALINSKSFNNITYLANPRNTLFTNNWLFVDMVEPQILNIFDVANQKIDDYSSSWKYENNVKISTCDIGSNITSIDFIQKNPGSDITNIYKDYGYAIIGTEDGLKYFSPKSGAIEVLNSTIDGNFSPITQAIMLPFMDEVDSVDYRFNYYLAITDDNTLLYYNEEANDEDLGSMNLYKQLDLNTVGLLKKLIPSDYAILNTDTSDSKTIYNRTKVTVSDGETYIDECNLYLATSYGLYNVNVKYGTTNNTNVVISKLTNTSDDEFNVYDICLGSQTSDYKTVAYFCGYTGENYKLGLMSKDGTSYSTVEIPSNIIPTTVNNMFITSINNKVQLVINNLLYQTDITNDLDTLASNLGNATPITLCDSDTINQLEGISFISNNTDSGIITFLDENENVYSLKDGSIVNADIYFDEESDTEELVKIDRIFKSYDYVNNRDQIYSIIKSEKEVNTIKVLNNTGTFNTLIDNTDIENIDLINDYIDDLKIYFYLSKDYYLTEDNGIKQTVFTNNINFNYYVYHDFTASNINQTNITSSVNSIKKIEVSQIDENNELYHNNLTFVGTSDGLYVTKQNINAFDKVSNTNFEVLDITQSDEFNILLLCKTSKYKCLKYIDIIQNGNEFSYDVDDNDIRPSIIYKISNIINLNDTLYFINSSDSADNIYTGDVEKSIIIEKTVIKSDVNDIKEINGNIFVCTDTNIYQLNNTENTINRGASKIYGYSSNNGFFAKSSDYQYTLSSNLTEISLINSCDDDNNKYVSQYEINEIVIEDNRILYSVANGNSYDIKSIQDNVLDYGEYDSKIIYPNPDGTSLNTITSFVDILPGNNTNSLKILTENSISSYNIENNELTQLPGLENIISYNVIDDLEIIQKNNLSSFYFRYDDSENFTEFINRIDQTLYVNSNNVHITNNFILFDYQTNDSSTIKLVSYNGDIVNQEYIKTALDSNGTTNVSINKILKISNNSVLLATSYGMFKYDLSEGYAEQLYCLLENGKFQNISTITKSILDEEYGYDQYLIAIGSKIYISEDEDLYYWTLILDLSSYNVTQINDIYVNGRKSYAICTNVGVIKTYNKYYVKDITPETSIKKEIEVMSSIFDNELSNHIQEYHSDDSPVTYLNLSAMSTKFDEIDDDLINMNSWCDVDGSDCEYVENDLVETMEFGDSMDSISAQVSSYENVSTGDDEETWIDLSSISYIVKNYRSNYKEIYIYLPTTNTNYISYPSFMSGTPMDYAGKLSATNVTDLTTKLKLILDNSRFKLDEILDIQINGNSLPLNIFLDERSNISAFGLKSAIMPSVCRTMPVITYDNDDTELRHRIPNITDEKMTFEFSCFGTDAQAIRIFGKAKAVYKIRFMPNGGIGTMADVDMYVCEDGTLPRCTFIKEGYIFRGWATSKDSTEIVYKNEDDILNETTGQTLTSKNGKVINLYAVWEKYDFNEDPGTQANVNSDGDTLIIANGELSEDYGHVIVDLEDNN